MAKKRSKPSRGTRAHSDQKLYQNTGVSILEIEGEELEPGAEFYADLDPVFEQPMLMGGHLSLLQDRSAKADRADAETADVTSVPVADTEAAPASKRSRS